MIPFLGERLAHLYDGNYKRLLWVAGLFFLFYLAVVLFFPGLSPGIDITGGNLVSLRSDTPLPAGDVEAFLQAQFTGRLENLTVLSVSGPAGSGSLIQFSFPSALLETEKKISEAKKSMGDARPEDAQARITEALALLSSFSQVPSPLPSSLSEQVGVADDTLVAAKEKLFADIQSSLVSRFQLSGKNTAFQRREVGPVIGEAFWKSAQIVLAMGLLLVVIVIFAFFREFIPSVAVIGAGLLDILGGLTLTSLLQVPLSLSTIPALMMMAAYSIDTNILLTTRLLKRKDYDSRKAAVECMKTGLTIIGTAFFAALLMLVFSYYLQMGVMYEISVVLVGGLFTDMVATWFMNAPVLLWYLERRPQAKTTGGR